MDSFPAPSGRFATGVNFWASKEAIHMWRNWDAASIEADLAALAKYGVQLLRCFPFWPDFQPIRQLRSAHSDAVGGRFKEVRFGDDPLPDTEAGRAGVDEVMLERFETFADLAQKYGMKLIVCPLTGQMTFGLFVPPALEGLDLYRDPFALQWEVRYLRCFVNRMKHHPAIAAWESGNETNLLGKIDSSAGAWSWTALIHSTIRSSDPTRPIIGVSVTGFGESCDATWRIEDQAEWSDLLSVHPYALWDSAYGGEEFNRIRNLHHAAFLARLSGDIGGKPCFVEETGTWRPIVGSYEVLAASLRSILWNLWSEDRRGLLWWCAFDQEKQAIAPYDWKEPGLEHGLFASDRTPQPTAEVLRDFRNFLDGLPFDALPARKPDAVAVVTDEHTALGTYLLARQAGIHLAFRHARQELPEAACYFLPSAAGRAGFSVRGWEKLLERVRNGATLYLSLNDTILSGIDDVFGAGVRDRRVTDDRPEFRFDAGFSFTLPRRIRYRMNSYGAEVLGREADGNPAFFRHRLGKGMVYLLNFPLEAAAANTIGGFETDAWKLYREILHPRRLAESPSPFLQLTEHHFADGRTALIAVNNQPEPFKGALVLPAGRRLLDQRSDSNATWRAGTLEMPPNSGLLLLLG